MGGRPGPALAIQKVELIYTAPQEFFFTQVKLAMFGGLVIAFPLIAAQIYKFVAPGLYKNERAAFLPFLIASPILFLMGAALVYFFFTPMVMWFFLSMQQTGGDGQVQISLLPKVSEYLSLIMTLIFSFGLVFQLPVVTSLMARVGLLSSQALREKRKWAIVIAFIVAAVLTPPDPISQISLAHADHPPLRNLDLDRPADREATRGRADRPREERRGYSHGDWRVRLAPLPLRLRQSGCRPGLPKPAGFGMRRVAPLHPI